MGTEKVNRYLKHILWIAGIIFVLRIPSFYQHIIDIDETAFSEFARIILNGGIPYVDAVDNKPPMTYFFFSLVYVLTGIKSLISVHVMTSVWVAITGIAVYFFGARMRDAKSGLAGAICFVLIMHTYEPKYISTNGETLINLFLVVSSFIFLLVKTGSIRNILFHVFSGVMLGLAVMTNYKGGILAFVFVIHSLFVEPLLSHNRGMIFKENFIKLLITGFSSFLPVAAFVLYFRIHGNFEEALSWGFLYNFGYIESGKGAFSSFKIIGRTAYFIILTLPAWFVIVKYCSQKIREWKVSEKNRETETEYSQLSFILLWLCFSLYAAMLGGRGYGHYYIQLAPPLSLATVAGYEYVKRYRKTFWIWLAVPALVFTVSRIDMIKSYELVNYPNYKAEVSFRKTGEYVKTVSEPGDRIYAWGWATPVYYFADRRCASRFLISDFVSGRVFGTSNTSGAVRSEMTAKFIPLLIEDLKKNRPLYFIDTAPSGYFGYDRFPLSSFPELDIFVKENYVRSSVIDGITIYKRKAAL